MTTPNCMNCVLHDSENVKLQCVYEVMRYESTHMVINMLERQQQVRVLD